jgi:hypothetical protein
MPLLAATGVLSETNLPFAAAELFLIALGALELLSDFASEHALLLVVDNAQWLDRSAINDHFKRFVIDGTRHPAKERVGEIALPLP